jgi:parallel beta-helix repeat protein
VRCPGVSGFYREVEGPGWVRFAWMKSNDFPWNTTYEFFIDGLENDTCENIENWGQEVVKRVDKTGPVTLKWKFEIESTCPRVSDCRVIQGQAWIAALRYNPDYCEMHVPPTPCALKDAIRNSSCRRLLLEGDRYEGPIPIMERQGFEMISINPFGTTIDGMNSSPCIGIESSRQVTIKGLRIINSSIGIQIQGSNNCTIESNIINIPNEGEPRYGIYLYDSNGNILRSNYIESQDRSDISIGIGLLNSSWNTINNQFNMLNRLIIWFYSRSCNNSVDLSHSNDCKVIDGNLQLDKVNGILSPKSSWNSSLSCQRDWSGI